MPDSLPGYIAVKPEKEGFCYGCVFWVCHPEYSEEEALCTTVSCHPRYRKDKRHVIFIREEEEKK